MNPKSSPIRVDPQKPSTSIAYTASQEIRFSSVCWLDLCSVFVD